MRSNSLQLGIVYNEVNEIFTISFDSFWKFLRTSVTLVAKYRRKVKREVKFYLRFVTESTIRRGKRREARHPRCDLSTNDDVAGVVCTCQVDASDKRSGISSVSATPETKFERRLEERKGRGRARAKNLPLKSTPTTYTQSPDNARCVEKCP